MRGSVEVDKMTISAGTMSRTQLSIYVILGSLFPGSALVANYIISHRFAGMDFDMLYIVGALFLLPRLAYLYVIIGSGIAALLLWIFVFRIYGKRWNGFIGGILLFNAFFYFLFGIAGIYRLFLIPVWLPPFCAAPILFLSGVRALKIARRVMQSWKVVLTTLVGFLFVILLSLFMVRQPWGLIRHLPDAQDANLSGLDLRHIYIDGCTGATFEGANLRDADLRHACLVHCDLNMHKVNLQGADLSYAFLSIVNLKEADMRGANLNHAEIYQVDFTGTDFRDASLGFYARGRIEMGNVNLCGADLSEVKEMQNIYTWEGAVYDSTTLWPNGFDPASKGAVLFANENTTGSN